MNQSTPPFLSNGNPVATDNNNHSDGKASAGLTRTENRYEQPQVTRFHPTTCSDQERKLIITRNGEIVREVKIGSRDITIGRMNTNDIQLNDLALSGNHARISSIPDYIFIEDLGSTNGTTVNGNHIKKVALEHGDIIQLGHYQITYLCEGGAKYEPTMFVKAEQDETQIIYVDSEYPGNPVDRYQLGGLKVLDTPDDKPVMELRKAYNTIGFQDKRMALITRGTSHYTITVITGPQSRRAEDIPLLNGAPVDTEQHALTPGDIITISGFKLQFYFLN